MSDSTDADWSRLISLLMSARQLARINHRTLCLWFGMLSDHDRFLLARWAAHRCIHDRSVTQTDMRPASEPRPIRSA